MKWIDKQTSPEKTEAKALTIYNVVILDKSGSMQSIRNAAVDGFNTTLKSLQKPLDDKKDEKQYLSLFAFCSCGIEVCMKDVEIDKAMPLKYSEYKPCCCTPLYDAMGNILTKYEKKTAEMQSTICNVVVITDGYENDSREYTGHDISRIIERLKGNGWNFTYIGADHDVEKVALTLKIENTLSFEKSEEGTGRMFDRLNNANDGYRRRVNQTFRNYKSEEERRKRFKEDSKHFFE